MGISVVDVVSDGSEELKIVVTCEVEDHNGSEATEDSIFSEVDKVFGISEDMTVSGTRAAGVVSSIDADDVEDIFDSEVIGIEVDDSVGKDSSVDRLVAGGSGMLDCVVADSRADDSAVADSDVVESKLIEAVVEDSAVVGQGTLDSKVVDVESDGSIVDDSGVNDFAGVGAAVSDSIDDSADDDSEASGPEMVDPEAVDSKADDSILTDSGADELGINDSAVDDSIVEDSEVSDLEVASSEVVDSKANDSTLADSVVDELVAKGPAVDHSAVESSIVDDSAVDDSELSGPEMVDSDVDVFVLPDSEVDEVGTEELAVDNSSCADSEVAEDSSSLSVLEVSSVVDSRGWVVTEKINVDVEVPSDVVFDASEGCIVGHLTPVDVFTGSGDVKDSMPVKAVVDSGAFLVVETLDISDDVEAKGNAEVVEDSFSLCKLRDSDASSVEDSTLSFAVGELCSGWRNELRALCVVLEIDEAQAPLKRSMVGRNLMYCHSQMLTTLQVQQ
ncbi:hypothetical protein Neosp_011970 [[Neocosmospora] mangrovei]